MGIILAIVKALTAAFSVFQQERSLYNSPEMAKNKLDIAKQEAKDAIYNAEAVLADPRASAEAHAEALRQIRLAGS